MGPRRRFSSSSSSSSFAHMDSAKARKASSPSGRALSRFARFSARVTIVPSFRPWTSFATRMASHFEGRKRRFGSGAALRGMASVADATTSSASPYISDSRFANAPPFMRRICSSSRALTTTLRPLSLS